VELLLVAAIIALLAGVGGGIYVGTYRRMLVERAARDFLLAAKHARITAIERQTPCTMVLDSNSNGFALVVYAFDEETGRTAQVPLRDSYFKKPVEFPGDVRFEHAQIVPISPQRETKTREEGMIVFFPNGTAQSAAIQIGDGRNHYTVAICAATGRAKVTLGTAENVIIGTIDLDEARGNVRR
jgi:Tfp pilus assembly protein FimT